MFEKPEFISIFLKQLLYLRSKILELNYFDTIFGSQNKRKI